MATRVPLRWGLPCLIGVAAVLAVQWALAGEPALGKARPAPGSADKVEVPAPVADPPVVRRREAVLAMPRGTFAKAFAVDPFVKGRLVWTYEDDRVSGTIELASEMGGAEAELAIESEVAMSSSGVVFGVITAVRLTELKINPQMLASVSEGLPIKIGPQVYPLVEPIINDLLVDLPFSYQCRVHGDRMTISNARIGPSGPANKYLMVAGPQIVGLLQAPALALEGTYTRGAEKEAPAKNPAPPAHRPR
jgi:hypothetical protein